jgi:hypothetical protein
MYEKILGRGTCDTRKAEMEPESLRKTDLYDHLKFEDINY